MCGLCALPSSSSLSSYERHRTEDRFPSVAAWKCVIFFEWWVSRGFDSTLLCDESVSVSVIHFEWRELTV